MAQKNSGSDLDVFEGLRRKSAPRTSSNSPRPSVRSGPRPMDGVGAQTAPLPPPAPLPFVRPAASIPTDNSLPSLASSLPHLGALPSLGPLSHPHLPSLASNIDPYSSPSNPQALSPLPPLAAPGWSPTPGAPLPAVTPPPRTRQSYPPPLPGARVNVEWDEGEVKTRIYDRQSTDGGGPSGVLSLTPAASPAAFDSGGSPDWVGMGAAAALVAGSGGAASAPLPIPKTPMFIPAGGLSAPTPHRIDRPPVPLRADSTRVTRGPKPDKRALLIVGAVALGVALSGGVYLLQPQTGTLVIDVTAAGRTVERAQVFVEGKKVCDAIPCKVGDIKKGVKTIKVIREGYAPITSLTAVKPGEELPVTINLDRVGSPSPAASSAIANTGFKVSGAPFIKVALDDKELGPLPQELKDLTAGDHRVKFYAGERYKPEERVIHIAENQIKDLGTITLHVLKGKATLYLDTPGAKVNLVSGNERKVVSTFPISVDIDASQMWAIEASKLGYEDYRKVIKFDDGNAEQPFRIILQEKEKAKPAVAPPPPAPTPPPSRFSRRYAALQARAAERSSEPIAPQEDSSQENTAADATTATLNINSIPPSNCILDGRPLGSTPKAGISVSPGSHTVVFIHPEYGRKATSITLRGGDTKSASVRFP